MGEPLVVFHPHYRINYPTAGVESPARVAAIHRALEPHYPILQPEPAGLPDLLRVHTRGLLDAVRREDRALFDTAVLAAGGAMQAAREALTGRPAFALIRPPGHHASPDHHWGFCFFNNMAVALAELFDQGRIGRAFILDFDLHVGDGTLNCFDADRRATIYNPSRFTDRTDYLNAVRDALDQAENPDIIGVSAGFDIAEMDWGGLLKTEDFREIGRMVKEAAARLCSGRRFAVLEGGYYLPELGNNVLAFCQGLF